MLCKMLHLPDYVLVCALVARLKKMVQKPTRRVWRMCSGGDK